MTKPKQSNDKQSINLLTGEIIENKEQAKESLKQLRTEKKEMSDTIDGNIALIKQDFNLDDKELVKQKKFFYKLYKTNWLTISNLSLPTYKVLKFLELNTHHKDNSITINGKYQSYTEMALMCNVSLSTFKRGIKELCDLNILTTERKSKYTIIYFNPKYMEDSMTEKSIYNKF